MKLLLATGIHESTTEKELLFDTVTDDIMKLWRVVHLLITFLLGILSFIHSTTIKMYSK